MAERLRVWLAGGHECDLDLGEGSAQDLMETIENAGDRSWFSTDDGRSRVRATARSSGLRSKASLKHGAAPPSGEAIREGLPRFPRTGLLRLRRGWRACRRVVLGSRPVR